MGKKFSKRDEEQFKNERLQNRIYANCTWEEWEKRKDKRRERRERDIREREEREEIN